MGSYICDCDVICGNLEVEARSVEEAEELAERKIGSMRVSDCEVLACSCFDSEGPSEEDLEEEELEEANEWPWEPIEEED